MELLQSTVSSRTSGAASRDLQLSKFSEYSEVNRLFKLQKVNDNEHVVVWAETGQEVVLYTQAFLADFELPPVTRSSR